jgi:hypothetical protein
MQLQQGVTVVGNGNIDVGNKTATRKPGQTIVEQMAQRDAASERRIDETIASKTERPRICGAMSQQGGDSGRGNQSAPQKFVQLVGFRDPKAQLKPPPGTRPAPVKR